MKIKERKGKRKYEMRMRTTRDREYLSVYNLYTLMRERVSPLKDSEDMTFMRKRRNDDKDMLDSDKKKKEMSHKIIIHLLIILIYIREKHHKWERLNPEIALYNGYGFSCEPPPPQKKVYPAVLVFTQHWL